MFRILGILILLCFVWWLACSRLSPHVLCVSQLRFCSPGPFLKWPHEAPVFSRAVLHSLLPGSLVTLRAASSQDQFCADVSAGRSAAFSGLLSHQGCCPSEFQLCVGTSSPVSCFMWTKASISCSQVDIKIWTLGYSSWFCSLLWAARVLDTCYYRVVFFFFIFCTWRFPLAFIIYSAINVFKCYSQI